MEGMGVYKGRLGFCLIRVKTNGCWVGEIVEFRMVICRRGEVGLVWEEVILVRGFFGRFRIGYEM